MRGGEVAIVDATGGEGVRFPTPIPTSYTTIPPLPPSPLPPRHALAVRLSSRHAEGGHVIDACTHVHKVHLCERRGKSRNDVNDPTALCRFSQSPSFSLSFPFLFLLSPAVVTPSVMRMSCRSGSNSIFPHYFSNNHRRP